MTNVEPLFQPFHSAKLDLANRIVMAPMTRSFSPGGVPGANVADYYARRADAQVGLIVTEGTVVNRPGAANDRVVARGTRNIVQTLSEHNSQLLCNLFVSQRLTRVLKPPKRPFPTTFIPQKAYF